MVAIAGNAAINSLLGRILVGIIAVIGSLRYGAGLYAWRAAEKLERPSFTVVRKLSDGVELRRYEPYLIAETTVPKGGFRESTSVGFRACASYIFGKNKPRGGGGDSEKMAMTAPVRVSGQATGEKMAMTAPGRANSKSGKTKVSFVIGSKYSLSSVPKPMDRNVSIRQVKPHYLAARKFSGPPPTDERVKKERARIEKALGGAGLEPASDEETMVYGYHDPFITPNLLRRNEVAVMVDSSSAAKAAEC